MFLSSIFRRSFSSYRGKSFAVAFDLDGVMYRGKEVIPSAPGVLHHLTEKKVPWILLTNGGGVTEEDKAVLLSDKLKFPIDHCHLQQSHTPYRTLVSEFKDRLILTAGSKRSKAIAEHYGFKKVVSTANIHALYPNIFPDRKPLEEDMLSPEELVMVDSEPIQAIFAFMDPPDYHRDLQICFDVICNNGELMPVSVRRPQEIPVYFSGPDFTYVAEWPSPRFGAGIFPLSLENLYKAEFGRELDYTFYGKPYAPTFQYAQSLIEEQCKKMKIPCVDTIYMVGDNPETDIRGATSFGGIWKSALVRTGVFDSRGLKNDPNHPADLVGEDVGDIIEQIEKLHAQ